MSETELEFDTPLPISESVETGPETIPQFPTEETVVYEIPIEDNTPTEATVDGDEVLSGRFVVEYRSKKHRDGSIASEWVVVKLECDLHPGDPEKLYEAVEDPRMSTPAMFTAPGDSVSGDFDLVSLTITAPPKEPLEANLQLHLEDRELSATVFEAVERVWQKQGEEILGGGADV